jgi:hypothetical protein
MAASVTTHVTAQENAHLESALGYLRSVYNSTVGLMSEQPYGDEQGKKLYWLNDNIFAYAALKARGTNSDKLLADKAHQTTINLTMILGLPHYSDGFPKLGIHEVILGYPISLPMPCFSSHIIDMGSYRLGFVIANGTRNRECVVEDFNGFADMILYQSLAAYYLGNSTDARNRFQAVVSMWDGNGIADSPFRNPSDPQYQRYATYKLALLLYVSQKLNETLPFSTQMAQTIWSMQAYNGGIITNYVGTNIPIGVVNTETTALVVLANPLKIPLSPPPHPEPPYMQILVALVGTVLVLNTLILVSIVRKRSH